MTEMPCRPRPTLGILAPPTLGHAYRRRVTGNSSGPSVSEHVVWTGGSRSRDRLRRGCQVVGGRRISGGDSR